MNETVTTITADQMLDALLQQRGVGWTSRDLHQWCRNAAHEITRARADNAFHGLAPLTTPAVQSQLQHLDAIADTHHIHCDSSSGLHPETQLLGSRVDRDTGYPTARVRVEYWTHPADTPRHATRPRERAATDPLTQNPHEPRLAFREHWDVSIQHQPQHVPQCRSCGAPAAGGEGRCKYCDTPHHHITGITISRITSG